MCSMLDMPPGVDLLKNYRNLRKFESTSILAHARAYFLAATLPLISYSYYTIVRVMII